MIALLVILIILISVMRGWIYIGEDEEKYQKASLAIKLRPKE